MQTRLHTPSLKRLRYAPGPALLALSALALAAPAQAGSITVNTTDCTLVNAINAANNANGVTPTDTVGVGNCTGATAGSNTLTLTADVTLTAVNHLRNGTDAFGLPAIQSTMVIEGRGYRVQRPAGNPNFDFINQSSANAKLTLRDLSFTGGSASYGALFCNAGTLNVTRSLFLGNAGSASGAMLFQGTCQARISNTSFVGNNGVSAGVLLVTVTAAGRVDMNQITVTGNATVGATAGAIYIAASTTPVSLANSIVAGNTGAGTDLATGARTVFLIPGGYNLLGASSRTAAQAFSKYKPQATDIVATSDAATGGVHTPTALSSILELDTSVSPNVPKVANNGGLTQTVALCSAVGTPGSCTGASPALNGADPLFTDSTPTAGTSLRTDQRGYARISSDTRRDIGAYEFGALTLPSAPTDVTITPGDGQLSVAFTAPSDNGGYPITNYQYSTDGGSTFTAVDPASTASPVVISGLSNGTTYPVRLRAVVAESGEGDASTPVDGTPGEAAVNGSCGTASGVATATAPVEGLCASGTASVPEGFDNAWYWSCQGSGTSSTALCVASYASQTITLAANPTSITVGGTGSTVTGSSTSGRLPELTSSTTDVCSVNPTAGSPSGSTVIATGVAAGTCTVKATLAGTGDTGAFRYLAAADETVDITVTKGAQTITGFAAGKTTLKVGEMTTLSATGGESGNEVSFKSLSSEICFVSGAMVTALSAGTCTVAADQAGNDGYNAATQKTLDITVAKAAQLISGLAANPSSIKVGGMATLSASGGASGNSISFRSSTSDICSVSGAMVTALSAGTCTVIASQAGNADFEAADEVSLNVPVAKAAQLISGFTANPSTIKVGQTSQLSAFGGASGKPILFASTTADTCSVSASTVTALAVGTCTVTASQAGSADFDAAETATLNIGIEAADVVAAPALKLDMNDLDFGTGYLLRFRDIGVETTSEAEVVTLSNSGTAPLSISSIVTTGDFRHTTTCGPTVAPGATCTISIRFSPKAVGTRTGETRITSNAVTSPDVIRLSGTGKGLQPAMKTNVSRFDFGRVKVGATSREQTLVITSTGSGPLEIRSIRVSGDYSGSHNCPRFLDAGKSCQVTGSFKPKAVGTRPGSVSILTSVSNTATEVSLTGTGF